MFKLRKKKHFIKFWGRFFYPIQQQNFGVKKPPTIPIVALCMMARVFANKTSLTTLINNLNLNLNSAAILKISNSLKNCSEKFFSTIMVRFHENYVGYDFK